MQQYYTRTWINRSLHWWNHPHNYPSCDFPKEVNPTFFNMYNTVTRLCKIVDKELLGIAGHHCSNMSLVAMLLIK